MKKEKKQKSKQVVYVQEGISQESFEKRFSKIRSFEGCTRNKDGRGWKIESSSVPTEGVMNGIPYSDRYTLVPKPKPKKQTFWSKAFWQRQYHNFIVRCKIAWYKTLLLAFYFQKDECQDDYKIFVNSVGNNCDVDVSNIEKQRKREEHEATHGKGGCLGKE